MIRQQPGDLLEIQLDDAYFYVVVLSNIAMFGGNIVFAFHSDGTQRSLSELLPTSSGFNVCTDLLYPKKKGTIRRLSRFQDTSPFWRTRLAKGTHEHRPGHKAKEWFIYRIEDLRHHFERTSNMSPEYKAAMAHSTFSFDLVAKKILAGYTPDQDPRL